MNPHTIIDKFLSHNKRNKLLKNKWNLKNIAGKQLIFVCEHLTVLS